MKKTIVILSVIMLVLGFAINSKAQENKKEKKLRIKIIKEIDGEIIKTDTTFVIKEGENIDDILKEYKIDINENEKNGFYMVNVDVDSENDKVSKTVIVSMDENMEQSYEFVTDDSTKRVIVMSGDKEWLSEGDNDIFIMSGNNNSTMYKDAKPGDTVVVKTIVSINGKETNVNEEEIIIGEECLNKKSKKLIFINEDDNHKIKKEKIIVMTDDNNSWTDKDENVYVFNSDGKINKIKIEIDDIDKKDLKKLKLPKKIKSLDVEDLFIMINKNENMNLSFIVNSKAKTIVRIYDENGNKLFEDIKKDFSGKYSNSILKMKGEMILQISQGKNYFHKELEIEY